MDNIKPSSIEHPLDVASRAMGGRLVLANALDVTVAAIGNWKIRGVPIEQCTAIEQSVVGAVTRRDLRPDDWQKIWPELVQVPAHQAQPAIETVVTSNDVAHCQDHAAACVVGVDVCQANGQGV